MSLEARYATQSRWRQGHMWFLRLVPRTIPIAGSTPRIYFVHEAVMLGARGKEEANVELLALSSSAPGCRTAAGKNPRL
ncbi:hypothetical protein MCOR02_010461 [Pyricularia oryzae]|uniref:Uncharacterized protein n=1 Tax=Pyricularia oryzae (strain 70-15 / ATCC MYA-4617 / FGSC 8958) TaxID=242507 RepID=G4MPX3_PYRO7|nr:uncharacterized protein MGG_16464 [Pyricularia oryzae 70-15]EHA58061.1 hypothetical protein MGG_16464 [Pyricularia oryzae 70-15]KAH9429049.1 hypothetical protein MCOR02_010461 [Pyricularia oryzae]